MNSELKPDTAYTILKELISSISTYHVDMGGKHRYCLNLKSHPIITKAKYFLETTEEKPESIYKKMWERFYSELESINYKNISEGSKGLLCLIRAKYNVIEKELTHKEV
jgi:hypothetical protein